MTPKFPRPWTEESREENKVRPPSIKDISDPEEEYIDIRFKGRGKAIIVSVPQGKEEEVEIAARTVGKVIQEICKLPGAKRVFEEEKLSFEKPLGPHIELLLGLPFYAASSTTNVDVARQMAIDRITCAISSVRGSHFEKVKEILKKHRMEMVTR